MRALYKVITDKHFWPLLVILFFAIFAARSLIFQSGYFNMHDDLLMMRQLQLEKCFLDGQIPCRWVPDMGYGFGFPLFNFYPPLPYLVGELFRLIGASFVNTVKLTLALSFVLSGVTMYLFSKEFFGRIGATLAAIFYIWAPYRAVDVYIRGAMNEAWSFIWFPLIFWAGYRLIKAAKKHELRWVIILSLAWFALLTSHNLMVLIFVPIFGAWILMKLWSNGAWNKIPKLIISGLWAFGLAAFFTFPAVLENKFTHIEKALSGYYDYTAHFATIKQLLFTRFWGYGPSHWGPEDGMPFQIGYLYWGLSLLIFVFLIVSLIRLGKENIVGKLKKDAFVITSLFMFVVGWSSAFMAHSRSTPIWLAITQLKYLQFPWRFLTITIFSFSFLVGAIPGFIGRWKLKFGRWKPEYGFISRLVLTPPQIFISGVLILFLVVFNWYYFLPEYGKMGPLTDEEKFSGRAWDLQQTAGIYDYLPLAAKMAPNGPRHVLAEVMHGDGTIIQAQQGTYWGKFSALIESSNAEVRINIIDFPEWKVFVDGDEVETFLGHEEMWGRIYINLSQGEHLVYTQLFNTPVRTVSNIISLASWGILIFVIFGKKYFLRNAK